MPPFNIENIKSKSISKSISKITNKNAPKSMSEYGDKYSRQALENQLSGVYGATKKQNDNIMTTSKLNNTNIKNRG